MRADQIGELIDQEQPTTALLPRRGRAAPGEGVCQVSAVLHRADHVVVVAPDPQQATGIGVPEAVGDQFGGDQLVTIVCPYDTRALDDRALTDALATHPTVWEAAGHRDSDHYDPHAVVDRYNRPLRTAPDAADLVIGTTADIRDVRRLVTERARRSLLNAERTADLELIATELVTNSLRHTGAGCRLRIWRDGEHLICSVEDDGRLTDPLAGRRPPEPGQRGGRGLLLVNQLADLVRINTTTRGTTVTAFLRADR
ncbi:anti-sigma regulatory factor (Ser/Thr protein kinase) [Saccharothrix carnea]|uniref:Anti-sigma regulatory factor (Ser/Thr protein kinase) n=1 Tax=Saccharothrix carnea TaxID=1280637 RepID=A0A2P8HZD8_SACCR|nr:anti-sigma regulatory factor (Ser/Thr protein kinase) [Saccharothrix carnea]